MKILVTYYSRSGNTKKVALDLAKKLNADIDEIVDLKDRSGIMGWIFSGRDEMKGYLTDIKTSKDPKDYDLVVIGTPFWVKYSTPAVRTYVSKFKDQLNKVAIFITSGSARPEKTVAYLEEVIGKKVVAFAGWTMADLKNEKVFQEKLELFTKNLIGCSPDAK